MSEDADFEAWQHDVITNLVPKMQESSVVASLVPDGPTDAKFAVELGVAIMLDKPIIIVVRPGMQVPAKLMKVADATVDWTDDATVATQIGEAMKSLGFTDDD